METMNIENIVMVNLKNFNKHKGKEKEKLGVHIMAIGGSLQLTNKDRHFIKMHKKNTKRF